MRGVRPIAVGVVLAAAAWAAPATAAPYSSHSQLYTCCTDRATKRAMFAEASASGAAFIRIDIGMETVAPRLTRDDVRHWGGTDEAAALSAEYGLPVVAVLHGTPPELTACDEPWERRRLCPPADPEQWATVAGEIAERYAGRIAHFQIWNEPDARWAFAGSAADYSRLLTASSREIKRVAPATRVVLAGMMNSHAGGRSFLDQVFRTDTGAVQAFDIGALHLRGPVAELTPQIPEMAAFLRGWGRHVPLWVTEHGYPSDSAWQNDSLHVGGEPGQASYLASSLPALALAGADQVFVTLHDGGGGAFDSEGILEGTARPGGSFRRKAGWHAFRDAVAAWPRIVAALLAPRPAPIDPRPCASHRRGTHRRDLLRGSAAGEYVVALRGNDLIRSAAGADCVSGGAGADKLEGGADRDKLFGGPGADRLVGGGGADRLTGNAGRDAFDGGAGNDSIYAVDGVAERVRCGRGRDVVRADARDRAFGCERVRRKRTVHPSSLPALGRARRALAPARLIRGA